jgi:hypothetical protein
MFEAKIEFFGIQVDDLKKENADLKMEVATLKTQLDSHFFVQCSLEVSSLADSSRRMLWWISRGWYLWRYFSYCFSSCKGDFSIIVWVCGSLGLYLDFERLVSRCSNPLHPPLQDAQNLLEDLIVDPPRDGK